jgi:hypothetical protein
MQNSEVFETSEFLILRAVHFANAIAMIEEG